MRRVHYDKKKERLFQIIGKMMLQGFNRYDVLDMAQRKFKLSMEKTKKIMEEYEASFIGGRDIWK